MERLKDGIKGLRGRWSLGTVTITIHIYKCDSCGYELWRSIDFTPQKEVVERYGGFCPKCGHKIENLKEES